jgi:hypothetical protein
VNLGQISHIVARRLPEKEIKDDFRAWPHVQVTWFARFCFSQDSIAAVGYLSTCIACGGNVVYA